MMNNNALFIISLQHELAMAIGNKLDLNAMLKVFLKVCFSRLNLTSAHVYIYTDKNGTPKSFSAQEDNSFNHLLSIPKNKRNQPWQNNIILQDFALQVEQTKLKQMFTCQNGQHLYGFIIPKHGVLIFETHYQIETTVQKALTPILNKLATSCYTSIVHDSLVQEVYSRQLAEETVIFQAQHDGLTGLYNRQHFNNLLANSIDNAIKDNQLGAVVFIDLNRFKPINDALGHAVGDKILVTLANRLHTIANQNIDIARFGGDEFTLLINQLRSQKSQEYQLEISEIIQSINQALASAFIVDGNAYKLSCSIGYALFPLQSDMSTSIIKYADIAMYEAKRAKTPLGLQYHTAMSDKINKRLAYIEDMKASLVAGDFRLHYQAQYNHSGQITGAEALLRWQHPVHGMESPAVYIPIAEESNLIIAIGQWVLEQACRDIKQLETLGLPSSFKRVFINISAKQLIQADFQDKMLAAIEQQKINAQHIALELTENLLVEDIEKSITLINALKAQSVDCAIDDFGTGYSSLNYLKKIPASVLKIDRSFVTNINQSSESAAIASMIISLGKTLNMKVLAEGVETLEELNCLKTLGCYHYQGFYFSKPLPLESFIELLNSSE
ncbi:bifunctional diguanylate cyclase/phosphodiesterase [Colwellia sp. D2M02]|uniref:putative bifunctional diguanylate cyclase/phosphodiesterase n=1 Tax=Colwellia sp. D2M02 TaxID=2841562 RepID=UPI001C0851DF|nr:bifunctional diguanylate cyclase/phosphodiesterase [Colwellia sp. D2M02]MBU2894609.1 bifunctional diguanylate cyclase/phosphodiesterase [Colwellia sp. D2M02]